MSRVINCLQNSPKEALICERRWGRWSGAPILSCLPLHYIHNPRTCSSTEAMGNSGGDMSRAEDGAMVAPTVLTPQVSGWAGQGHGDTALGVAGSWDPAVLPL